MRANSKVPGTSAVGASARFGCLRLRDRRGPPEISAFIVSPFPEPILIAEEPDFFVVAKPPHVLSHPTRPDGKPTLLGWLQEKYPGEFVALVNRLDRETSCIVLVARSPAAASQ